MTDEPTPDLSKTLEQIAEQAKPVDLSKAVARRVRTLRRRRNAAGGAAAVLAVAIVGGGGYALSRTTGSSSADAGSAAPASSSGWYAYSPLPDATPIAPAVASIAAFPTPIAPSSGIITAAPATGYTTDNPSPAPRHSAAVLPPAPLTTPAVQSTPALPVTTTTGHPGTNPDRTPAAPITPTTPTTTGTSPGTSAARQPCTVFDDFSSGAAGSLVITDAMKAKARAMGDQLCELVGGGAHYNIELWISTGGLSGLFNGLTYDVQAHLNGAGAGSVDNEAWLAVYQAPAGTTPTFNDGTMITLQTKLATSLKAQIEVPGGPFDAFAKG